MQTHKKVQQRACSTQFVRSSFVRVCVREGEIVSIEPVSMHECVHECCRAVGCCRACVRACRDSSCLIEFDMF